MQQHQLIKTTIKQILSQFRRGFSVYCNFLYAKSSTLPNTIAEARKPNAGLKLRESARSWSDLHIANPKVRRRLRGH